jgi:hypothetical protein
MYIVAMLTMLIDHIGIVFAPDQLWLRMIGRLAMPIYCYCLVQGYQFTRSQPIYLRRLVLLAVISQIPYSIALEMTNFNIIGAFVVCLLVLMGMDRVQRRWIKIVIAVAGVVFLDQIPFDYGAYTLLVVLMYRYVQTPWLISTHVLLNSAYVLYTGGILQMLSTVSTIVLVVMPSLYGLLDRIRVKRWIWRSFYPAHLAVLAIFQTWFVLK